MSEALVVALARAAIDAVDPRHCTAAVLRAERDRLGRPCTLFAFGKAARGMAQAALDELEVARGIVLAQDDDPLGRLVVRRAGHPSPVPEAAAHGAEVDALARSLGDGDLALVLISGGGSSMLELPVAGVSVGEVSDTARALMRAGADISELNAVRRCLSRVKGGGLAEALFPAEVLVVVISDVPGAPSSVVASGPCSPPPAGPDPREVVRRYGVIDALSASVRAAIDTFAERAPDPAVFARVREIVAADVRTAAEGARAEAARRGLRAGIAQETLAGEARIAGPRFARTARDQCARDGLDAWIAGGETTVRAQGSGRGGRNQEAALAVALEVELAASETFLATTTDGVDGTSDAAAAWVDAGTLPRARALGLDPRAMLDDNDSHALFAATGTRLVTGPTGTNVADVWVWLQRS